MINDQIIKAHQRPYLGKIRREKNTKISAANPLFCNLKENLHVRETYKDVKKY